VPLPISVFSDECDKYFHYFQMQNNEKWMDLTYKIWGMFIKTLQDLQKILGQGVQYSL